MVQSENEPILATGGYDHTIKIWAPYSGTSVKTLQHTDSQVYRIFRKFYRIILNILGKCSRDQKLPRCRWISEHSTLRSKLEHKSINQL
jgi:hypothetical protein